MAKQPPKQHNDSEDEDNGKASPVHTYREPKLVKAHPFLNIMQVDEKEIFIDALLYYANLGMSEKNIKIRLGQNTQQFQWALDQLDGPSGRTNRELYNLAKSQVELKRLELKEDMLDSPDTPINLKYKLLRDDLRTMPEHSPVTANSGTEAEAGNAFNGYFIEVIKKEGPPPVNDEPDTQE